MRSIRPSTCCVLHLLLIAAAGIMSFGAAAQEPTDFWQDLRLGDQRPLDQGVEDVGPLSISLRIVEPGLDPYSGFRRVFAVPGHPGLLMRVEGGLYAVFPRSSYAGGSAQIPMGTVFHIGPPVMLDGRFTASEFDLINGGGSGNSPRARRRNRPDEDRPVIGIGVHPPFTSIRSVGAANGSAIITSAAYRSGRLMALMREAAEAERERNAGDTPQGASPDEADDSRDDSSDGEVIDPPH